MPEGSWRHCGFFLPSTKSETNEIGHDHIDHGVT